MKAKALLALFREATLVGEVTGARLTYAVFDAPAYYILITQSGPRSGNFNLVDRRAVDRVRGRFGGRKDLTSGELLQRMKRVPYVRDRFDALRVLYVLEALGEASRRQAKPPARGFLFNVRKSTRPPG